MDGVDSQILMAERQYSAQRRRKGTTGYWGLIAGIAIVPGLVMLVVFPPMGLLYLPIVGVAAVLGIGVAAVINKTSTAQQAGAASSGPVSFGQVYTMAPPAQVWPALQQAAATHGLFGGMIGPTTMQVNRAMGVVTPSSKVLIDVRPSYDRPGMGVVSILAEPTLPVASVDYGRHQGMVNALLFAVPQAGPAIGPGFTTY